MNGFFSSGILITIPALGDFDPVTAICMLYAFSFIFGFGVGYILAFIRTLFFQAVTP